MVYRRDACMDDGVSSNSRSQATLTPRNTRAVSKTASTRTGGAEMRRTANEDEHDGPRGGCDRE